MREQATANEGVISALTIALESLRDALAERDELIVGLTRESQQRVRSVEELEEQLTEANQVAAEKDFEIQCLSNEIALLREVAEERAQLLLKNDRENSELASAIASFRSHGAEPGSSFDTSSGSMRPDGL